jgi:hypothetical protein
MDDKIMEDKMCGVQGMYGGKGKCIQCSDENTIRGHLEYLGVTGRVTVKYT